MYKSFSQNIKQLSLIIGYLNLLRSFYYENAGGNINDKSYVVADKMVIIFKKFCKNLIKNVEILIKNQKLKTNFALSGLDKIENLIISIPKPANPELIQEVVEAIHQIRDFIDFLTEEFPDKHIEKVDLIDIKTAVKVFKYQIYLS